MEDYRLNYLAKNCMDENFKIVNVGVNFTLEGDKGTKLEMKPIIPRSMIVDQGETMMVITKSQMVIKKKREKKAEQLVMDGVNA